MFEFLTHRFNLMAQGRVRRLPMLIYYPTERCNLKCSSCSYGGVLENLRELSLEEISVLAKDCRDLGTTTVMLSGGEPLLRSDLPEIARIFRRQGMKLILLTNGTYLLKRSKELAGLFEDCYVSIDGPSPQVHDVIRGVPSFNLILQGLAQFQRESPSTKIAWRTVVQKRNFRFLREMAQLAKDQGAQFLSFVAADVSSAAFGRSLTGQGIDVDRHLLNLNEVEEFRQEITRLFEESDLGSTVLESRSKMFLMADYFDRINRQQALRSPPCTAPIVSLVVDSRGNVLPCFFIGAQSNIRERPLKDILNIHELRQIRLLRRRDQLERCRGCVCSFNASLSSLKTDAPAFV